MSGRHSDLAYLIVRIMLFTPPTSTSRLGLCISQERGLWGHGRGAGNWEGLFCMAWPGVMEPCRAASHRIPKFSIIPLSMARTIDKLSIGERDAQNRQGMSCISVSLAEPNFRPFIIMEEGIN